MKNDTCAGRLSMLVQSRRKATGLGIVRFLAKIPQSESLPAIDQDYLTHLEYRRKKLPVDEPRFWLVAATLGISPEEIVSCILSGIRSTVPPAVRSLNPSLFQFPEENKDEESVPGGGRIVDDDDDTFPR